MKTTGSQHQRQRPRARCILLLAAACCGWAGTTVTGQETQARWRYTFRAPGTTWTHIDFDDSTWAEGPGGFGTERTPGGRVGTAWETPNIWLRRTFTLNGVPNKPVLLIHHDEDAEVFINGRPVASFGGYSKSYQVRPLSQAGIEALVPGRNVLAVHCRQTRGGQYIDVDVIDVADVAGRMQSVKPPSAASTDRPDRSAEPDKFNMLTTWGERVTPENAWREYPRPQLQRGRWLCLNGHWDFAIVGENRPWTVGRVQNAELDPLDASLPPVPQSWPHKILVPFSPETRLSGIQQSIRPHHVIWYRRTFRVPEDWSGQRILLHFEAVDWHAVVLLNGTKVAENKGGYVPFTCDLTDRLISGGEQQLLVAVWDPTNMGDQTVGKQALPELRRGFRYTPNSGIWQSVWLEPVPPAGHIERLKITPVPHRQAVEVIVQPAGSSDGLTARVIAQRDGTESGGSAGQPLRLELNDQYERWSPASPSLHDLTVELRRGDQVLDRVQSYFALRTIDVAADGNGVNRIRLNGQPIFQFGPLDQGYWPDGAMTPPSEEAIRYDLQYLKDIGCNMVRVHIKVHPRAWYSHADRLGLLVWQDFVCSRKFDTNITPASAAQWEAEQRRMLDHLHNHPAVVTWIVFNEGWGQYDTERLTKWTKDYDPSRLVTCASGWTDFPVGDIYDNHDYSFNISPAHAANFNERATLCGECGGFNVLIRGHLWHETQTQRARVTPAGESGRESYDSVAQWQPRYRAWLTNLRLMRSNGLNAAVYTQISDVEHECNGWLTYDRKVSKFPVEQLGRWHRKLYEPIGTRSAFDLAGGDVLYHVGKLSDDWASPDFDTSDWSPISTTADGPLRPVVQTDGDRAAIYLRGALQLSELPAQLAMHTSGAGRWRLYLNGELAMTIANSDRAGHVPYSTVLLPDSAVRQLRRGRNIVALELAAESDQPVSLIDFALLTVDE